MDEAWNVIQASSVGPKIWVEHGLDQIILGKKEKGKKEKKSFCTAVCPVTHERW